MTEKERKRSVLFDIQLDKIDLILYFTISMFHILTHDHPIPPANRPGNGILWPIQYHVNIFKNMLNDRLMNCESVCYVYIRKLI